MRSHHRVSPWFLVLCLTVMSFSVPVDAATPVFINELHYDNTGADADEGVEIAGPAGTDLTGWRVRLYNGATNLAYGVVVLSGFIPNQCNGFGTIWFPELGVQNGSPDGLALVDAANNVIQFLSYEGSFVAGDGEAVGLPSTDIGVSEASDSPLGFSLQLGGVGSFYEDFTWAGSAAHSRDACNNGQTFVGTVPVSKTTWGGVKA
ncbi:MAG TPA: lamin tail domain-containing protein, partial [Candidatus Krumholzibacteria bacterium]|nr:lamin tail domain-containing protein [Candidatus Krumholzibacteria bacterium]